ncbi:MAG: 3-oxoacyl-[acyl-carrier-protein] reductase [Eubacteriales bacterium]
MLKGKTAVVTGGSRGIGRAVCLKLAENGADIALIYASSSQSADEVVNELTSLGVHAQAYCCHVQSYEETSETVAQIVKDFGHIDILVNNAGITRDKLMLSMKESDFDDVIDVNLKGVYNMMRHIYPLLAKQKSGKIINISSVSGLIGNAGQTNYSASKAGIIGLTKSAARELAGRGICCNAIAPGFIETDMTVKFVDDKAVLDKIPMKRMGKADEVANLALFLASGMSDYITGEVIRCDGGMAM